MCCKEEKVLDVRASFIRECHWGSVKASIRVKVSSSPRVNINKQKVNGGGTSRGGFLGSGFKGFHEEDIAN